MILIVELFYICFIVLQLQLLQYKHRILQYYILTFFYQKNDKDSYNIEKHTMEYSYISIIFSLIKYV